MSLKPLVIIPTYNEKQNIEKLIAEILGLKPGFDVLVIDDNSPDGTEQTVRKLAAADNRISLITRPAKLGLGSAYLEGFKWAVLKGYERMFMMDADFSHQPKYLPELNRLLEENDMAVGSRYIEGGGVEGWPRDRKLLSRAGNYYARNVLNIPVRDCTSGFIGITRALAETILEEKIASEGYAFLIEIKNLAVNKGFAIREYPIVFIDRVAGVSKISKSIIIEALFLALKLRFGKSKKGERGNDAYKALDRYLGIPLVWLLGLFTKKHTRISESPSEILVIKLSAMGDSILLIPAVRALRAKFAEARITVLCTDINSAIFKGCPYINSVIMVSVKKLATNPLSIFKLHGKTKYDIAVDFDQWVRLSALLSFFSGAKARLGFKTEGQFRHYSYTDCVEHLKTQHEITAFLSVLRLAGIENADEKLEFHIDELAEKNAFTLLESLDIGKFTSFVVLHPETPAHGQQRHWPAANYIELAKAMIRKHRVKVLITGTKNEESSNIRIVASIGEGAVLLPSAGIATVAAVIAKARAVVCGNTGIMHLACALDVPVVALHGPTDPRKWGPRCDKYQVVKSKLDCSPCLYLGFEYKCASNRCMKSITVEEVQNALDRVAFSH